MTGRRALVAAWTVLVACSAGAGDDDVPPAVDAAIDAAIDGPPCVPGTTECTNCLDDDQDGRTDADDVECLTPGDDDEGSWGDGSPDGEVTEDCFFDDNTGSGDDGCRRHPCCVLGITDVGACPIRPVSFDPATCDAPQSDACRGLCEPLTHAGCDCFGCCTVCGGADPVECFDIFVDIEAGNGCDRDTFDDPDACPRCVKAVDCGAL